MSEDNKSKTIDEDKWKYLVELAPDGIVTLSMTGFVTSVNSAFCKNTGFTEEEVVGKHFSKLGTVKLKDIPRYTKIFFDIIRGKVTEPQDFDWTTKNGELRWGEAHFKLIKYNNKSEIMLIARDVTERKRNDELLKKSLEELKRSNAELDDYTYAVSHDLKAPLRTIESFSSFLLEDHSDNLDDEGKEYLKRMILATKRMNALIQDLLLISRVGRLYAEKELIDLNEVISEITDDMEITLNEKNGEIIYTELPSIKSQKVWIKQVFSNLINNGLKFNESPNPRIWIKCEERKDHYILSVKDNGIGIDKKHHDKIFKIFQRLNTVNEYPGTGAGLTMCKKIIESMGGNISLDSKLGKGSTFYITIPKGSEISEESEPPYQSDDSLSLVHENINNEH